MKKFILVTSVIMVVSAIVFELINRAVESENKFRPNGIDYFNPEYRYSWDRVG